MIGKITNNKRIKMKQNEKPYQPLAWIATAILICAACLASFVPELEYHHWAFITANSIWVSAKKGDAESIKQYSLWIRFELERF